MKIHTKRCSILLLLLLINFVFSAFAMPILMNYFFVEADDLFAVAFAQLLGFVLPVLILILNTKSKVGHESVPLFDIKSLYGRISLG